MHGLEYNPDDGMLYGGSFDDLYRIDKTTGAETLIAAATVPGGFLNLGYDTMSDIMYGMTAPTTRSTRSTSRPASRRSSERSARPSRTRTA